MRVRVGRRRGGYVELAHAVGAAGKIVIAPECGPEVLKCPTRLRAGTSQKMVLTC